jgi:hypothetical protein
MTFQHFTAYVLSIFYAREILISVLKVLIDLIRKIYRVDSVYIVLMDAVLHEFRFFDIYHRTAEVTFIHLKGLPSLS